MNRINELQKRIKELRKDIKDDSKRLRNLRGREGEYMEKEELMQDIYYTEYQINELEYEIFEEMEKELV